MENPKILIVENEVHDAIDAKSILSSHGYNVLDCLSSGEDAIHFIEDEIPDCIIIDTTLSRCCDGIDTAGLIQATWGIPIIYLTAEADEIILKKMSETKSCGYIEKPIAEDDLCRLVSAALHNWHKEHTDSSENIFFTESLFLEFVNSINDLVIITDLSGIIVFISDKGRNIFGEDLYRNLYNNSIGNIFKELPLHIEQLKKNKEVKGLPCNIIDDNGNQQNLLIDAKTISGSIMYICKDNTEKKEYTEREKHLYQVIGAIRNVNQLTVYEKDISVLIEKICINLTETRGYYNAWIALYKPFNNNADDPVIIIDTAEAGIGDSFYKLKDMIEMKNLPNCMTRTLKEANCITISSPLEECRGCLMSNDCMDRGGMTAKLEYKGIIYGILTVSLPERYINDTEEVVLFTELIGVISYALYNIEQEQARIKAEELIVKKNEKLEVTNQELQSAIEEMEATNEVLIQSNEEIESMNIKLLSVQKELMKREAMLESVFRAAPVGIGILHEKMFQWTNKTVYDMTGYSNSELIGKKDHMIYTGKEEYELVDRVKSKQIAEYGLGTVETKWLKKDGSEIDIILSSTPLHQDNPEEGMVFTALDITMRKETEKALGLELTVNKALSSLSEKIIDTSFSIKDLAGTVAKFAMLLTESEHCIVNEIDSDTDRCIFHVIPEDYKALLPLDNDCACEFAGIKSKDEYTGVLGYALNTIGASYSNSIDTVNEYQGFSNKDNSIKCFIAVPAFFGGSIVGRIALSNVSREYTDDDLYLLQRLSELYAIAINRIRNENQIRESLKEKEILIKEIHHRVKNNMQIISSLFSIQIDHATDKEMQDVFRASQDRIRSMALVHEQIYQSDNLAELNFLEYIECLAKELSYSYMYDDEIEIKLSVDEVYLDIDTAIPCAMIINELATNAIKHAFPNKKNGVIDIHFSSEGSSYVLFVKDNGIGLPQDIDISDSESMGLQLVSALNVQLRGTLELNKENGTEIKITFQKED